MASTLEHRGPRLYGDPLLEAGVQLGIGCVIGYPRESWFRAHGAAALSTKDPQLPKTVVGARSIVGNYVVLHDGTSVGHDCVIEDRCRFGYGCLVGARSRVMYAAYLCDRVQIGEGSRIAGFLCDGSVVGNNSTVLGSLVHEYTQPDQDWWDGEEAPPKIEHDVVVGMQAMIVGGVTIGHHSYVAAGAVVTRDVPSFSIAVRDRVEPIDEWRGRRLQPLFQRWLAERSE